MSYQQKTKNHSLRFNTQQGVVIIVALFIVALVASLSCMMMIRLDRDIRRTTLLWNNHQALLYAEGALAFAKDLLRDNLANPKENSLPLLMPVEMPLKKEHEYVIYAKIEDAQAKYNVNNLMTPAAQIDFKRLIETVNPELSEQSAINITLAISDWLSASAAENSDRQYDTGLPFSYRAAHRAMLTTSELALVKGMTPTLLARLTPYVIALPTPTPINIQTAAAPVLMTLSDRLTLEGAKKIVEMRKSRPFASTASFLQTALATENHIAADKITIQSHYFLVHTVVSLADQQVITDTLLLRTMENDQVKISVIWQSYNGY